MIKKFCKNAAGHSSSSINFFCSLLNQDAEDPLAPKQPEKKQMKK